MWKAWAIYSDEEPEESVEIAVKSGEVVTTKLILDTVESFFPNSRDSIPMHLFRREEELSRERHGLPGRDAISIWARQVDGTVVRYPEASPEEQEPGNEVLVTLGKLQLVDDIALGLTHPDSDRLQALTWNAKTLVAIPIPRPCQSVRIEYTPEIEDAAIQGKYEAQLHQSAETFLQWCGYFGSQSTTIGGMSKISSNSSGWLSCVLEAWQRLKGLMSVQIHPAAYASGIIIGTIVHRITTPFNLASRDPFFRVRLWWFENLYKDIAQQCPRLEKVGMPLDACSIIFIHGTRACCLTSLYDLFNGQLPSAKIYRYEHDTFRSITENAEELCRRITNNKNGCHSILLVGHSRGGLVARVACQLLSQANNHPTIKVLTYGTPYQGTPIVDGVDFLIDKLGLLDLGTQVIDAIPVLDPYTTALKLLLAFTEIEIPDGIRDMSPSSTFLELLRSLDIPPGIMYESYGSKYDFSSRTASGHGLAFRNGSIEGFLGKENDLIVSFQSSHHDKYDTFGLTCSHFDYFKNDRIQQQILSFCNFALPLPQPAQPVLIEYTEDGPIINGLLLRKRKVKF